MNQQLEMDAVGETSYLKDLLCALKNRELIRFQDILEREHDIDIDYCFGDPEHGTLLDISCMTRGCHLFVNSLLSYGSNPNIINKLRKKAPLHFAVQNNDLLTVENLLNFDKTEINILDSMGNTPLHLAVKTSEIKILELLLKNESIKVNSVNRKGKSALFIALEEKNKAYIHLLLQNENLELNSDPNFSKIKELLNDILPEWKAVYKLKNKSYSDVPQYDNVFNLLHSGKYSDFISVIREKENDKKFLNSNDGSYTFLQYCCNFGLIDVLRELLRLNVDPNTTTSAIIRTPIMIASYKGYPDIVKMLIDTGKCSFDPVNQETVLHCVVKGSSESPGLGDNNELKKDHLMCLSYLLAIQRCQIYVNFGDIKGNTALHFAAKQGENMMVLELLKAGASLNCFNMLDEPTFADINYKTLKEYLDSCIYANDKLPREETYEIILNYTGLKPVCSHSLHVDSELGSLTFEDNSNCKNCNNFETKSLLYLSQDSELKYLLKHPVVTSFLHLKWHKIHKCFCINLLFYFIFWATLTLYILNFYPDVNISDINTKTSYKSIYLVWFLLNILVFILMLREIAQFCIAPFNYFMSFENWLEIALISITFAILWSGKDTPFHYKVNLSAIGIMLSWSELVLLIGRHPILSTQLEMLKTVSWNFLMFLAWYSVLIAAFAISFYILFGKHECSDVERSVCSNNSSETDDDFFRNPGVSFFKTVIMLTGEFDASSIPFDERPGTSHVLFVAFVFLIAIVLFNLLNGLAVSDIQAIKSDAELVGYISRVKLIGYIETLVMNPLPIKNKLFCWNKCSCQNSNFISYYKNKLFSRCVNIFQTDCLSKTCEIRILPNLGNYVEINQVKCTANRKESGLNLCCKVSNLFEMDSGIVHSIKKILAERTVDEEIKEINNRKMENEQLLIKMMNDCQDNLKFLRDICTECKEDIEKIKKAMNFSK